MSWAMPRASLRSVLTGIALKASRTCRVSSSSTAKPAFRMPAYSHCESGPAGLPPVEWRGEIRASCGCTHGDPFHAGPRLGRGAIADGRVQTLPIVEDFDV